MLNFICWIEELMYSGYHVTTNELCSTISIGKGSVVAVIEDISSSMFWSLCVLPSHFDWTYVPKDINNK
jgi:hypothetical protein